MDDYGNRTHEEPSDQGVGGCAERFRRPDRVHGEGGLSSFAYFRKRLARRRDLATGKCQLSIYIRYLDDRPVNRKWGYVAFGGRYYL